MLRKYVFHLSQDHLLLSAKMVRSSDVRPEHESLQFQPKCFLLEEQMVFVLDEAVLSHFIKTAFFK